MITIQFLNRVTHLSDFPFALTVMYVPPMTGSAITVMKAPILTKATVLVSDRRDMDKNNDKYDAKT